jgi:DNA-binding IclR family transcriptional regulator
MGVLTAFDGGHPRLSLTEIAHRAGLPAATTYRLVRELERWRALRRGADGCYEIGPRMWQLGLLSGVHSQLRAAATPVMQDLYTAHAGVIALAVRDGDTALLVERLAGHPGSDRLATPGGHLPLHATAVGKVLLAHAPGDVLRRVLSGPQRLTPFTVVHPGPLLRELSRARAEGVARAAEEHALGSCEVAVPVRDGAAVVAALAVGVTGPRRNLDVVLPALRRAADTVGDRLTRPSRRSAG